MTPTNECASTPADHNPELEHPEGEPKARYGVLTGPKPGERAFCFTIVDNYPEAGLISDHVPGSWVGRWVTARREWAPVDPDETGDGHPDR